MKQNKLLLTLSAIALLGGLGSCSRKTFETDVVPSGETTTATPSGKSIEIRFWHTFGQSIVGQMEDEIDKFKALVKEHEGVDVDIKLEYQGGYPEILDKMSKAAAVYDMPTMAVAYPDHVATYLGYEKSEAEYGKYVYDLSKFANDPEIGFGKEEYLGDGAGSDFVQAFMDEGTSYLRDGMYSLPLMKSTEVMIYNKDVALTFAQKRDSSINSDQKVKNYIEGMSWDEFMEFCQYIVDHKNEDVGVASNMEWPAFYDSDSNMFITSSIQQNIPYISVKDGQGSNDFNNDQAKANVTKLKGYYDKGLFSTKGATDQYGSNYFKDGKTIFDIGSTGGAGYNIPTGDAFSVGICRVPGFNKNNIKQVSQGITVTLTKAKDDADGLKAKYAWKFLKYVTNASENALLCTRGSQGYMPVRHSAFETKTIKRYMELDDGTPTGELYTLSDELVKNDSFYTTPTFKGAAKTYDSVGGILSQVFLNKKSVNDAFTDAYSDAQKAM